MQLRDDCTTTFIRMLRSVILKVKFEINAYFLSFCVNLLLNSLSKVDMNGFELCAFLTVAIHFQIVQSQRL